MNDRTIRTCAAALAGLVALALAACAPDGSPLASDENGSLVASNGRAVAEGGGEIDLPPADPPFHQHSHQFAFQLHKPTLRGSAVTLEYRDLHEGAASDPIFGEPTHFNVLANQLGTIEVEHLDTHRRLYFEARGMRTSPGTPGPPSPAYVCVWTEDRTDGNPDRFHLETPNGYNSGGPQLGCPALPANRSLPGPPAPDGLNTKSGEIIIR